MKFRRMFMVLAVLLSLSSVVFSVDSGTSILTETLLNQDPDPVEPGDYVELRFKIEKGGNGVLEDVEYELVPEYPFYFDDSDVAIKKIESWKGNSAEGEHYVLYYKLKVDEEAIEDSYELTLLQRQKGNSVQREIDFNVRVDEKRVPELIIGNVETSPGKLIADYEEGVLKVQIVNVGDKAAEQVIVDLDLPDGFKESFGYSSRANIGTINEGQSGVATFYFDTEEGIAKGNHGAVLIIRYKEADDGLNEKIKVLELPFEIQVFGRPEYQLVGVNVSRLVAGKDGVIDLKIKNVGSREADSVSIQVFKDSSQPFSFVDKSDFIGMIDINEIGESMFEIEVDEDALAKEYRLKFQIRSVVDNDVLVEDENIIVVVDESENESVVVSALSNFGLYFVFLIIGILLGVRISNRKKVKCK